MNRTIGRLSTLTLATTSFVLLTGYDACGPVIENNGFDLWCGEELCSWELEKGEIARVPTWHTGDYGVDMIGDAVAIAQVRDIDQTNIGCLRFDLVALVEETATVNLEIDFYADGSIEVIKQIPTSDYRKVSFLIRTPLVYDGILFRVTKTGSGSAVLAQIYADRASDCDDPPPATGPRPLGARCATPTDCASNVCAPNPEGSSTLYCGECLADSDCGTDEVCGAAFGAPHLPAYRSCVPAAAKTLGLPCGFDAECISGICSREVCSTCESSADCGGGSCTYRVRSDQTGDWRAPYQCEPTRGGAVTGEECLLDSDCASGTCSGVGDLSVCEGDSRPCTNGSDCPEDRYCVTVGTAGATCQ